MKYLKAFLPKEIWLDTTILLISMFFIEIVTLCFITKFYNFYICFQKNLYFLIYNFSLFYNVPLFSDKSAFRIKFIASFLLIKLIISDNQNL